MVRFRNFYFIIGNFDLQVQRKVLKFYSNYGFGALLFSEVCEWEKDEGKWIGREELNR